MSVSAIIVFTCDVPEWLNFFTLLIKHLFPTGKLEGLQRRAVGYDLPRC